MATLPHVAEPQPARTGAEQARLLRLWSKSEDVAMHFNDLILNFRLKALGALTVGAGLFGSILLTREHLSTRTNFVLFACAMTFLAIVWVGIWVIDFGYYSRLLRGAVREAIRLEKEINGARSLPPPRTGLLLLSHAIEEAVAGRRSDDHPRPSLWARWWFYGLPFGAFVLAAIASTIMAVLAKP